MSNIRSRYEIIEVCKGKYLANIIFSERDNFGSEIVTEQYWVGCYYANYCIDKYMLSYHTIKTELIPVDILQILVEYTKKAIDEIIDDRNYPRVIEVVEYP